MSHEEGYPRLVFPITGADHVRGPMEAPITVVEYGDYECSFCGEAYGIIKQLQSRFSDEMRFVFRNFPLTTSHPHAEHAAEAAEAAGGQGRFWSMHDVLFENQSALSDENLA